MYSTPSSELLITSHDDLGESPVWDHAQMALRWTDITGRALHTWDSEKETVDTVEVD